MSANRLKYGDYRFSGMDALSREIHTEKVHLLTLRGSTERRIQEAFIKALEDSEDTLRVEMGLKPIGDFEGTEEELLEELFGKGSIDAEANAIAQNILK